MGLLRKKPMPVNHEIKSQVAKLLATEDLVVEHKKVSTACFNVHTRVLTLPLWERASNNVYDLLVGHEVGHALYTPDDNWIEHVKVPPSFVNIVEDARVEKLMKRKYAGLAKTFFNGYKELNDDDFFQIKEDDISKMNLADRVNLWFKVGNYIKVPIERGEETDILNAVADAESFSEVLVAAEKLYLYCKKEKQEEKISNIDSDNQSQNSGSSANDFANSSEESENGSDTQSSQSKESSTDSAESSGETKEDPEVRTAESFNDNIQNLANMDGVENVYVEIPKLNTKTIVINNKEIHEYANSWWQNYSLHRDNVFEVVDREFFEFKKSTQKEVNYLVKEFECRKTADAYSRASTARTGVLDCTKLHTYKYNEDLFKKITVIPEGKNHGLIFVLDWSGSMSDVIVDTLKQMYNLMWFCKKVSIPFEVYAFTTEWNVMYRDHESGKVHYPEMHYTKKAGVFSICPEFSLMNIFTSKVKTNEMEKQMKSMYRIAYSFRNSYCAYQYPTKLSLSGTPLNESLMALHYIIPQFKQNNKVQKVQCIVLTDGEANPLPYHVELSRSWDNPETFIGSRGFGSNCFIRNRKTGMTYKVSGHRYTGFTTALVQNLKDSFPEVNFVGIRIVLSREVNRFISNYVEDDFVARESLMSQWKKQKSFAINCAGYNKYFGISSASLANNVEFEVDKYASKLSIRNAFKKSLNSKKMNKKFLNEFISMIA